MTLEERLQRVETLQVRHFNSLSDLRLRIETIEKNAVPVIDRDCEKSLIANFGGLERSINELNDRLSEVEHTVAAESVYVHECVNDLSHKLQQLEPAGTELSLTDSLDNLTQQIYTLKEEWDRFRQTYEKLSASKTAAV